MMMRLRLQAVAGLITDLIQSKYGNSNLAGVSKSLLAEWKV